MRHERGGSSSEELKPGIFDRLRVAFDAARELFAIRGEIFRGELAEGAAWVARGALGFVIALALLAMVVLLVTALIASLFALLFGSAWAGVLATLVLYLAGAGAAAYYGVRMFGKARFDFPATREGLSDDVAAVRAALVPPEEDDDEDGDAARAVNTADPVDAVNLEERFRSGSE